MISEVSLIDKKNENEKQYGQIFDMWRPAFYKYFYLNRSDRGAVGSIGSLIRSSR